MKIALHDSEHGNGFPNLALMKVSAWHKSRGDCIEWFNPLFNDYDKVYSSKVFTWTTENPYLPKDAIKGGTGYGLHTDLSEEIEHIMPDYSLYDCNKSYGFLTRGCPNKCQWCIVPKKEGNIHKHADVQEFAEHREVVLMDNNVLACDFGIEQLDKIARLNLKVDFNQGLDARLVDRGIAKRLAKIKWEKIRFACDQKSQMKHIEKAVTLYREESGKKGNIFIYVLVKDIEDALERVEFLRSLKVDPFAQPYRDFTTNKEPDKKLKRFARWVNHKAIFNTIAWKDYK